MILPGGGLFNKGRLRIKEGFTKALYRNDKKLPDRASSFCGDSTSAPLQHLLSFLSIFIPITLYTYVPDLSIKITPEASQITAKVIQRFDLHTKIYLNFPLSQYNTGQ